MGPPWPRLPQGVGGKEQVHPGVSCGTTLCPAWRWVAFRHTGLCVFTELCPGTWRWEGSRKKGQWEEKERDDALDIKLLEPAAMG